MKLLIVAAVLATLAGCDSGPTDFLESHRCDRKAAFKQCMELLPTGPVSTKYNDWDEVVDSCDTAAERQSRTIRRSQQPDTCEGEGK